MDVKIDKMYEIQLSLKESALDCVLLDMDQAIDFVHRHSKQSIEVLIQFRNLLKQQVKVSNHTSENSYLYNL